MQLLFRPLLIEKSVGQSLRRNVRLPRIPEKDATKFKMNNATTSQNFCASAFLGLFTKPSMRRIAKLNTIKSVTHDSRKFAVKAMRKSAFLALKQDVRLSLRRTASS